MIQCDLLLKDFGITANDDSNKPFFNEGIWVSPYGNFIQYYFTLYQWPIYIGADNDLMPGRGQLVA